MAAKEKSARAVDLMNIVQNIAIVLTKVDELNTRMRDLSDHISRRQDDQEGRLRTVEANYYPKKKGEDLEQRVIDNHISFIKIVAYCAGAALVVSFFTGLIIKLLFNV